MPRRASLGTWLYIAVFSILADVVKVKTGSRSTAHWSNDFIRLNGWLRNCFPQLITLLDIGGIGQNWEDSNIFMHCIGFYFYVIAGVHGQTRAPEPSAPAQCGLNHVPGRSAFPCKWLAQRRAGNLQSSILTLPERVRCTRPL